MISAKCTIPRLAETDSFFPNNFYADFESGISGGSGWNGNWKLGAGSHIQNVEQYTGNYSLENEENAFAFRSLDFTGGINMTISFYAKFVSVDVGESAYFSINDGTEHPIDSWTDGDDDDTWRYYEYNITGINPCANVILEFTTDFNSAGDQAFYDDIYVSMWKRNYTAETGYEYQEVRGSGEVHVIDPVSTIINGSSMLNELLWNFQFDRDNPELLSNHDYCIDNQTLGKTLTFEYCLGGDCRIIQRNETIPCDFGCNNATNSCNANPLVSVGIIIAIILGFAVAVWEVLKRT
jgi:hypothetical protein